MPGELDRRLAGIGHLEEQIFRIADLVPDFQEAVLPLIGVVAKRQARQGKVKRQRPAKLEQRAARQRKES
jgi:hypothetical protein